MFTRWRSQDASYDLEKRKNKQVYKSNSLKSISTDGDNIILKSEDALE